MAKVDLGEKRVCPECTEKFYDLGKRPAVCPMCGFSYNPDEVEAPSLPNDPLPPEDDGEEAQDNQAEVDEEDVDEDEAAAKELELDGDDAAIIGSISDDDDENSTPNLDGL